ncbi:flavodoxin domain-containing protein [Gorillibacterium timonense]|uniref:flavodoxin domain-containing protein n=1 Tax=Gorillibacterium timonense TaxID=1689269 RepID=UPI00071C9CF5|nr:flavodoxin domain-containing protein [Gorillibacterium timonense]
MKSIVIYATKYGSTAEVAKRIKAELGGEARLCNIMTDSVPPLDVYDTVILGGSIYVGKVQKKLTNYISRNLNSLLTKNVGLYLCAGETKEEGRLQFLQKAYPDTLYRHAAVKEVLGYAYAFDKMNFLERWIIKKIKGDNISTAEYDNDGISQFAAVLNQKGSTP